MIRIPPLAFLSVALLCPVPLARAQEGSPVYFNEDPVLLSRVRKFLEEEEGGRYPEAIAIYREVASYISSQPSNRPYLYQAEEGLYLPVEAFLRNRVQAFPPGEVAAFRREADLQARPQWEEIVARGDVGRLRDFLRRNALSSLIPQSVEALAGYHVERGEFDEALGVLGFLHQPDEWTAEARLLRSLALQATGREEAAAQEPLPEGPIPLGGRDRPPGEVLTEVEGATPVVGWRSFGGDPTHSRVPEPAFDPGRRIASQEIPQPESSGAPFDRPAKAGPPWVPYFPIHDGKRVILSDTFVTSCLDIRTGSLLWSRSLRGDRSVPWGHETSGHFPTASRDAVFVTLTPREAAELIVEGEGEEEVREVVPGEGYRVMALEFSTGGILWDTSKRQDVGEDLEGAAFVSSPLLLGDRLFVQITRLDEEASTSIVSLNALTGDKIWETHVCTTFSPMMLGRGIRGAYLAGGSGRIYASTNLGAIACLDAVTGGILWVRAYLRHPADTFDDMLYRGEEPPVEAPILVEGTVLAAPVDSPFLYAFDSATGRVLWRFERSGQDRLVGVREGAVIVSGEGITGIDGATGKVLWENVDLPGAIAGRPAIAGDLVYVPTLRGLFMLRVTDGTEVGRFLWSHADEEAGNLVFAGDRMLTVSPSRVNVYEDRGDTLQALAALPAAQARLGEGELLLRRGSAAKAAETLEEALGLARGEKEKADASRALARAHRTLGDAALEMGDLKTASSWYEKAIALMAAEERTPLLLRTGEIHERMGSGGDAVRLYRQILLESAEETTRRPSSRAAILAAGRIRRRIEAEGRAIYEPYEKEAERLLEKVGTLDGLRGIPAAYPNSLAAGKALLSLVQIYEEGSEWSLAAGHLETLLERAPDSPPSLYRKLAKLYERAGRDRRARKVYRLLASMAESAPEVEEARERLGETGGGLPDVTLPATLVYRALADTSSGRPVILAPDEGAPLDLSGTIIVAVPEGIESRDAHTGLVRWRRRDDPTEGRQMVVLRGDRLYLPHAAGVVALAAATGDEIWSFRIPDPPAEEDPVGGLGGMSQHLVRRAAADERHVVVTALPGVVYVLDAVEGHLLRTVTIEGLDTERDPVFTEGKALLSLRPAGVALLDPEGEDPPIRHGGDEPGISLSVDPVVGPSGLIHLLIGRRKVVTLRTGDLTVAWEVEHPWISRMTLVPDGGPLLLLPHRWRDEEAAVRAMDPATGREIWSVPVERSLGSGPVALGPDAVYFTYPGDVREIRALSLEDGSQRWSWKGTGWNATDLFVTLGYLVAFVPDSAPPSRLVFLNRLNGEEEAVVRVPVDYKSAAEIVDETIVVVGSTGIFGYGRLEEEALRRELATLEESGGGPEAVAAVRFALGRREAAVDGLEKALLREDLSYEEYQRLFEQMEGYRAAVAETGPKVHEIPRVFQPPEIDGDLRDWYSEADRVDLDGPRHISGIREGGGDPIHWVGREDLSGRLYMGWDNRNFYFALDVEDTYLRPYDSEAKEWKGDCLIIAIDPKNNGGYWSRADDILVTLALQVPREDDDEEENERHKPKGKYFVKRKDDESGAVYEAAIPWQMFIDHDVGHIDPERGPEPGFTFGFNPVLTDEDAEGRARKTLSWTPGIRVHRWKDQLYNPGEIVPEYYGKVRLK